MFKINSREISKNFPPYIIAELSANHSGSISNAKKLIKSAKENGADAVKIQTYTPDTMTINSDRDDFLIKQGIWKGYKLYDLYKEAHTPYEWHGELFDYAKELDITIFSSPFDETAVDLLEDLRTPAYKIASFELIDLPLIKYIAKTKKPILMSTGMSTASEIEEAVCTARDNGCKDILLFHCVSSYPNLLENSNLKNITYLQKEFDTKVGLSDHTISLTAAIASTALGATAIEKHFILNKNIKSPDRDFSIDPTELRELKTLTKLTWEALGQEGLNRSKEEKVNRSLRRSLYFVNAIKKGEKISKDDIKRIRPGYGIPPKYENNIIGKIINKNVERGMPVKWEDLKNQKN